MKRLVAIVGPTAVGKTDLAMNLAQTFNGEVVSADSRQVYRYVDIGTAKPSPEERALVPHHLVDVVDPDEDFSLAMYQEAAYRALEDIERRGKSAFLVGGSGLYVQAVTAGFKIPEVGPDYELRRMLEEKAANGGGMALYAELQRVDPDAAGRIDPRNVRRVVRALEVCHATGLPFSTLQRREPRFRSLMVGLTTSREDLYSRIDNRVDTMIERGLVQEVQALVERGYPPDLPSLSGLGYRQIAQYLQGEVGLDEVVQRIKHETHRFARHQYAWFRPSDESIHWFDVRKPAEQPVQALVSEFLGTGEKVRV
jgi:tRNA dimethylallyltransferase